METLHYKLQQFDPGIVWLDKHNMVTAMNSVAMNVLGNLKESPLGKDIINFHPVKSRAKIQMLLHSSECPMDSPPPISMMINAIDRLLMIKVSKMHGEDGAMGTCMVFYDLTDVATGIEKEAVEDRQRLALNKVPVYKNNRILLVDLKDVICIKAEGHYCSLYTEDNEYLCNLSLSDLESALFIDSFRRVHRSYIVNLDKVREIERGEKRMTLKPDSDSTVSVPVSKNHQAFIKEYFNLT